MKNKKRKNNGKSNRSSGSSRKWWGLISLALILRILIGGLSYHTDTKAIYRDASYIKTGVVSGYLQAISDKVPLPYPPATYIMFNGYQRVGGFLFSDYFETWMSDWGTLHTVDHPQIFKDLWAMKLPMFVADMLVAWLVYRIVRRKKFQVVGIWLLNPFSLYSIYAIGQFDIIPTALVLFSLWLWRDRKNNWAYILMGMGAGFKLFPLMMLPILWLKDSRKLKEKAIGMGLGLGTFLIMLLPILKSLSVLKSVFLSNLSSGAFKAVINLGNGEELSIYMALYLGLLLWTSLKKERLGKENRGWEIELIAVYGLLFSLSRFHPQWMTWIMPFLLIMMIENRISWKSALRLMVAYLGTIFLIDDKFVGLGLLKAVNNSFDSLPTIRWAFDRVLLGDKLQMVAHAGVLVGVTAILIQGWRSVKIKTSLARIEIKKVALVWGICLVVIFLGAHVPVNKWGRYVDTSRMNPQKVLVLTDKTVFKEKLEVNRNYFSGIEIRIKNVNLRNQNDLMVRIMNGKGKMIEEKIINGRQIGDDFDLKVIFDTAKDIETEEEWWVEISSPRAPIDHEFQLGIINKDSLAYTTYFNPGGWKENLIYSLKNIADKL